MRLKVLALDSRQFCNQWRGEHHYKITDHPLPLDAFIVDCRMNKRTMEVELVVHSNSYPQIAEGEPIPYIDCPMGVNLKCLPS